MSRRLTEKQIAAIEYLSIPNKGGLSDKEIAEKVGVSDRTIYRWKNDDTFYKALTQKIVRDTASMLPDIMASIPGHIINDGNAALFRTLMQAHGLLTDRVEVEQKGEDKVDVESIRSRLGMQDADKDE